MTPADISPKSERKVWWLLDCGHEIYAAPGRRGKGGCGICLGRWSRQKPSQTLADARPDLAAQWHPALNGDKSPETVTTGSAYRAWWTCDNGHVFQQIVRERVRKNLRGCPCTGRIGKKRVVGVSDLATTHPWLVAQWHPEKNDDLQPQDVSIGNRNIEPWWLLPECGHEFTQRVDARAKTGCPVCSGHIVIAGVNDLATTHPQAASRWHPTRNGDLTPQQITYGTGTDFWWVDDKGHPFQYRPWGVIYFGAKCDECAKGGVSRISAMIRDELRVRGYNIAAGERVEDVRWGKSNRPARCDMVLPERRLVIEYDGSYWHQAKVSQDFAKTSALLNGGWAVIRLREQPLPSLGIIHDRYFEVEVSSRRYDVDRIVQAMQPALFASSQT